MDDFKFVSEEYSIHQTQNYRLSIQINPDGFSALMTGPEKRILQIIHKKTGSIEATHGLFRAEEPLIKLRELNFRSISIIINSIYCSLVPSREDLSFSPMLAYHTDFPSEQGESIITDINENYGLTLVFQVSETMKTFISGFHNNPQVQHFTSRMLGYEPLNFQKEAAFIYTTPGLLHISIRSNSELKIHTSLKCKNDDEVIYHIMNTLRNFDFFPSGDIYYAGHLGKKEASWKLLVTYLPGIKILPNPFPFELAWDVHENYFTYLMKN